MEGITAALVGFIFVCILFPRVVKNSAQFYTAIAAVVVMILFWSIAAMAASAGFSRFVAGFAGLLQLVAFVMLILSTGGLSLKDFSGEFKNAFEVIRRGESEKEVIVPLTGEQPKPRRTVGLNAVDDVPPPPPGQMPPSSATRPVRDGSSLPLE